mgnify:CR=1 FL=1
MKKTFIFMALAWPVAVRAGEALAQGLPGMSLDAPAAESTTPPSCFARESSASAQFQRPDADRILSDLSAELRLSSKQEERITEAVDRKGKDFDKLLREYDKAAAEEKKWRYKVNELKYGMNGISKGIPDVIREFLDDDQRQNFFDALTAQSGNRDHRRPIQEFHFLAQIVFKSVNRIRFFFFKRVPFVDDQNHRTARFDSITCDICVQMRYAFDGINNHNRNIGAFERFPSHNHRHFFR